MGFLFFKIKVSFSDNRFSLVFLGILVIALFLRWNPNLYLTGGQDQGTYVSLSKQYEINHSLYIKDEFRESLTTEARKLYDRGNIFLGINMRDREDSTYLMPFYPVFPSWMSTFATMFGSDNRVYALTMFSILSIVATYLFAYEISNRNKKVGLLAAFLMAINPLHVYFSRVPVTEIVSLTFLLFSLYFLTRFYNDYKEGITRKYSLVLSLLCANVLFYTRMNAIFFLPIIILIPILSNLFNKDKELTKYLKVYSIGWVVTLLLSFLYYKIFLPYLFNLIVGKRLLNYFDSPIFLTTFISLVLLLIGFLSFKKTKKIVKSMISFFYNKLSWISISIFGGLILYGLYFYVKEIFIDNGHELLSFDSLSYLKQLSFLATFLYLSPIGFVLLPVSFAYLMKKRDVKVSLLIVSILGFLVYCWGILRLTQYHYYFARYQLSELIPLGTILISVFLVDISKKKIGKIMLLFTVVFSTLYFGYFSILQMRDYEGADRSTYEYLDEIVGEEDLLIVPRNEFMSFNQVIFPLKYYYGLDVMTLYKLSDIEKPSIVNMHKSAENTYILTKLGDIEGKRIKLVKEIDFKHNYFVHCNRNEDAFFEMKGHSKDIPFCEYIVIPNRFYYGSYDAYLFRWE